MHLTADSNEQHSPWRMDEAGRAEGARESGADDRPASMAIEMVERSAMKNLAKSWLAMNACSSRTIHSPHHGPGSVGAQLIAVNTATIIQNSLKVCTHKKCQAELVGNRVVGCGNG